ncbi:MAG: SDR family oxidoreductase [Burkholderiales bacterium]
MGKLDGKVALVTGGGSGLGQATARLFIAEGARVAIAGRDAAKLKQAAAGIPGGERILIVPTDVTDPKQVHDLVDKTTRHFGRIDVLVNNAGTNINARRMRELTVDAWNQMVRTHLDGAFFCIHEVLPQMLERKDGVIVNVNSISGKRTHPAAGAGYAAGKFGLHALAGCLASEERESGIRVSSIYPGAIDTPQRLTRPTPETADQQAKMMKPEDVANAVLFVATLPPHVSVPELIIRPTAQAYI